MGERKGTREHRKKNAISETQREEEKESGWETLE